MSSHVCAARGGELRPGGADAADGSQPQWRLKYCTARSCFSAAARVLNVPRLRRRPVFGLTLRELETVAARLELADHRRLPRAACALRMLRFAARRCALVAIVNLHRWSRRFANREEAAKVSAHLRVFALTHRQNSGPDRRA